MPAVQPCVIDGELHPSLPPPLCTPASQKPPSLSLTCRHQMAHHLPPTVNKSCNYPSCPTKGNSRCTKTHTMQEAHTLTKTATVLFCCVTSCWITSVWEYVKSRLLHVPQKNPQEHNTVLCEKAGLSLGAPERAGKPGNTRTHTRRS